jgi:hypothetical protein
MDEKQKQTKILFDKITQFYKITHENDSEIMNDCFEILYSQNRERIQQNF